MSFGLSTHRRQTLVVRAISNGAVSQIGLSHFCLIIDHSASGEIASHHPHGRLRALAGEYLLVVGNGVNIGTMLIASDPCCLAKWRRGQLVPASDETLSVWTWCLMT